MPCIFLLSACTFSFIIHGKLAMNHLLRRSAQVQIYRCLFERSVGRCCVSHALLIVTRGEITRVRLDSSFQPLSRGETLRDKYFDALLIQTRINATRSNRHPQTRNHLNKLFLEYLNFFKSNSLNKFVEILPIYREFSLVSYFSLVKI